MPRSVSLVGLAQIVCPQNNSTSTCSVCDPVILAGCGKTKFLGEQL
jgi:hypothetical protein